jgi:ubiquinone/menaquinone biosynthesis C-methylase UbiE
MSEIDRLKRVYQNYRESPTAQLKWDESNLGNRAILRKWHRKTHFLLEDHGFWPLTGKRILEIGCGTGNVLASLLEFGANAEDLLGVDLLPDRIAEAQKRYPHIGFECANAEQLDFTDASFDLILVSTVFSSILDSGMAKNVAAEVCRLLKPGGAVLWYDFRYNNPRNPHVKGMTKHHIRALFPGLIIHLHTITLLPPLARRLGLLTTAIYPLLSAIPVLRTHYLGLLIKAI